MSTSYECLCRPKLTQTKSKDTVRGATKLAVAEGIRGEEGFCFAAL